MRPKLAVILAPALAVCFLAVSAEAQQHKATRLGNPATRFARKLPRKPDDVRLLLRGEKTKPDVAAILNEVGWKGNLEDLDRAAAAAEMTAVEVPSGTRLPFMASRKNRKPHALMDVLWAGKKPIPALAFEMSSNCVRYRVVVPTVCGNFWIEDLGKDTTDPKCAPPPPPPVVSLSGADSACVTQPVEFTVNVKNPPADGKVALSVNGKDLTAGTLSNGTFRTTFPGASTPGRYEVKAVSGGQSATTVVEVKPCEPTCGITVSPLPAKAGKPMTVDVSGSRVAAGVKGGIRTAKIEVLREGKVVDTFEMPAGSLTRNDVVIKKGGIHTVRAVVTDEAGQTSTNACQADVDVKGGFPIFVGGYFGKERLTHDDASDHDDITPFAAFSRCAPEAGLEVGVQPKIGDNAEFEAALGVKFPFDDDAHTTLFADAAVNRLLRRGFFGGGVSWWDIGKDSTGVGLLLQGGVDLTKDGKWQLVGQTRVPFFNQFDDVDNNYQFWGGFRFKPNSWK
jgi:hypothetical protein